MARHIKILVILSVVSAVIFLSLISCRLFGLLIPFGIPTGSMQPAISPGDHVIMENFSYLFENPRRGDIVVFRGLNFPPMDSNTTYDKRIVGEPGEHLQINDGKLFIDSKQITLSNFEGQITYFPPANSFPWATNTDSMISSNEYFLIGDNSTNSLDSRFFGCVPGKDIRGRIWFCYWPLKRIGFIK